MTYTRRQRVRIPDDDNPHGLPWRVHPWGDGSSPTGHSNIVSDTMQVVIASEVLTETAEFIVGKVNGWSPAVAKAMTRFEAGMSMRRAKEPPKFDKTYCSQCGGEFGPGNSGFSHCADHTGIKA